MNAFVDICVKISYLALDEIRTQMDSREKPSKNRLIEYTREAKL
jgi:hypothetical protein